MNSFERYISTGEYVVGHYKVLIFNSRLNRVQTFCLSLVTK